MQKTWKELECGTEMSAAAKLKRNLQGVIFFYPMKIVHFLKNWNLLRYSTFHSVHSSDNDNIQSSQWNFTF